MTTNAMLAADVFSFRNTYVRLPGRFFARVAPTAVAKPSLIRLNAELATSLGIDPQVLSNPAGIATLAGNRLANGSEPIAMAYAGHQFGNFVPQLGDGRAILLGEVIGVNGARFDVQLKGAGRTPFSRRGDGRAALGPVLREYLVSEAFHALSIPTTRALAAVTTGEKIQRDTLQPGAVLIRVASSHIRVGTFQFFAAQNDHDAIRELADYVIARHYPEAGDASNRYIRLLDLVIARQAELIARWLSVGFVHGVMNTDNTSICGETIDFGPCAFIDAFDPNAVFSSIDRNGRYAYSNQANIALWNLARFAECLLPMLGDPESGAIESAKAALANFPERFHQAYLEVMRRKFGLLAARAEDFDLIQGFLNILADAGADFTLSFRALTEIVATGDDSTLRHHVSGGRDGLDPWILRWRQRISEERGSAGDRLKIMRISNPIFIPRNHLVEDVISAAVDLHDFAPFERLLEAVTHPFDDRPADLDLAIPPRPEQIVRETFCGT